MKMQMHRHRATGWQKTRAKNRSSQYLSLNETSVREPPACLSPNSLINHHRKATRNTERPPSSSSSPYSSSYLPSLLEELMSINIMSCPAPTVHTALCGLLGGKRGGREKKKCWLDPDTVSLITSCSRLATAGGRRERGQELIWVGQGVLANRKMPLLCGDVSALKWHKCFAEDIKCDLWNGSLSHRHLYMSELQKKKHCGDLENVSVQMAEFIPIQFSPGDKWGKDGSGKKEWFFFFLYFNT